MFQCYRIGRLRSLKLLPFACTQRLLLHLLAHLLLCFTVNLPPSWYNTDMKTPSNGLVHPNAVQHQAIAQSITVLQQTLDQAETYHQMPLFTDAFSIGSQIAAEAHKSLMAAKAKMSLLPTMGVQGSALVQTHSQIALHFHWSAPHMFESESQRAAFEQQLNHPHNGFEHMRQLRQLGIDPIVAAWSLVRPICTQALDAAQSLLKNNQSFGAPMYMDRALLRAPFFCAAVLSPKYQPKSQSAVELFPAPSNDWPEHFQVLCVQLAQLTIHALELTQMRADFEERSALKTLLTQLEHPAWISVIEHNALEQALGIAKPSAQKESSKRLEMMGSPLNTASASAQPHTTSASLSPDNSSALTTSQDSIPFQIPTPQSTHTSGFSQYLNINIQYKKPASSNDSNP